MNVLGCLRLNWPYRKPSAVTACANSHAAHLSENINARCFYPECFWKPCSWHQFMLYIFLLNEVISVQFLDTLVFSSMLQS